MTTDESPISTTFHGVPESVSPSPRLYVAPFQMNEAVFAPSTVWMLTR